VYAVAACCWNIESNLILMARAYHLMCSTCKEFLDIHKFRIAPHICDRSPLGIDGVPITQPDIDRGITDFQTGQEAPQWIVELLPFIKQFSEEHADHDLKIVDDARPDYYWWPEHMGYTDWKETATTLNNELFLPRNVVDDLCITEWPAAEAYLKSLQVNLFDELELNEYREKFKRLTEER
jgi:hypothetical protein